MAREVRTWLVDDTDGVSDAEETLTFARRRELLHLT